MSATRIEGTTALVTEVASAILDAVESGSEDVYPDPFAIGFTEQFESSPKESERQVAAMVTEVSAAGV